MVLLKPGYVLMSNGPVTTEGCETPEGNVGVSGSYRHWGNGNTRTHMLELESVLISGSCIATKSHTEVEGWDCKLRCVQRPNDHQNPSHLSGIPSTKRVSSLNKLLPKTISGLVFPCSWGLY